MLKQEKNYNKEDLEKQIALEDLKRFLLAEKSGVLKRLKKEKELGEFKDFECLGLRKGQKVEDQQRLTISPKRKRVALG